MVGALLGGGLLAAANAGVLGQLDLLLLQGPDAKADTSDLPGGPESAAHHRGNPRSLTGAPGSRSAGSRAVARRTAFSPLDALGDWRAEVSDEAAGETLNLAPDPVEDAAFALTQRRDGFGSDEVQSGSGSRGTADAGAMSSSGSAMSSGGGGLGAGGAQGPDVGGVATDSGNPMASDLTAPTAPGPVPEPETWTLLVLGAGLAGATLRRRARRVA